MACNNKLTLRKALEIQAGHLNAFGSQLTFEQEQELRRRVDLKTHRYDHVVGKTNLDTEYPMYVINRLVPRGQAIEAEAKRIREWCGNDLGCPDGHKFRVVNGQRYLSLAGDNT